MSIATPSAGNRPAPPPVQPHIERHRQRQQHSHDERGPAAGPLEPGQVEETVRLGSDVADVSERQQTELDLVPLVGDLRADTGPVLGRRELLAALFGVKAVYEVLIVSSHHAHLLQEAFVERHVLPAPAVDVQEQASRAVEV